MVTVHTYSTIDVTKTLPCTTCHGGMTTVVVSSIVEHTKTYLSTTTAANPIVSTAGSEEPTSVSAFTSEFDSTVASSAPSSDFSASVSAWATESSSLDTASASFSSSTTSDFNTSWTSTSANRRPTSHKIKNSGASGFSINVLLAAALALAVAVFSH
ncbi:hypothetical protein K504DRAFT_175324 [Pleomassaria siparia CBS 279.74]|uniref:Uncharacterized protein n=1 Tax=Pleomassaria siparia CBS 279.74 TaxID=1314801 RepID=A0A6G1JSZ9_9PLEO|nr:hypothetical protein K504DRAFT_175324 [Pleomassaria siparia CBS 279.74]